MGEAIGQSLPLAIGVALSPVPIIAVVLMLGTPRARSNGLAFVIGWLLGLGVVGAIVLALAGSGDPSENGEPATGVSWLKIVVGVLLLLVAVRQFRGRPREGEEVALPKWMTAIDRFGPAEALGGGAVLAALNPKNLLLAVGGAAAIAQTGISAGQQAIAYAVFAVIGTVGVGGAGGCVRRDGRAVGRAPWQAEGVDGPQQRRHHGRALPGDRDEADRRRDQWPHMTTALGAVIWQGTRPGAAALLVGALIAHQLAPKGPSRQPIGQPAASWVLCQGRWAKDAAEAEVAG